MADNYGGLLGVSPPQLGGMTGKAQDALQSRAYQLYVAEQQQQGLPVVSAQEFAQGRR